VHNGLYTRYTTGIYWVSTYKSCFFGLYGIVNPEWAYNILRKITTLDICWVYNQHIYRWWLGFLNTLKATITSLRTPWPMFWCVSMYTQCTNTHIIVNVCACTHICKQTCMQIFVYITLSRGHLQIVILSALLRGCNFGHRVLAHRLNRRFKSGWWALGKPPHVDVDDLHGFPWHLKHLTRWCPWAIIYTDYTG